MKSVQLGLKENWKQFWLLVFINALVGGMIGLERTLLPEIAEKEFHQTTCKVYKSRYSYRLIIQCNFMQLEQKA
jgi:hypothetical protein